MSDDALKIIKKDGLLLFSVKVVPRSSKTQVAGIYNGMLKIKLSAVPEKGKANEALIDFLSDKLNVPKAYVTIISGLTSKIKQVSVKNVTQQTIDAIVSERK
jgi:uncharacterized protein (TIGR00251 family)